MVSSSFSKVLFGLGVLLVLISFVFLFQQVAAFLPDLVGYASQSGFYNALILITVLCMVSACMAAVVWYLCLKTVVPDAANLRQVLQISFVSQIAKYIPGNIAHQVGKLVLCKRAGMSTYKVSVSIVADIFATVLAAALVGLGALVANPGMLTTLAPGLMTGFELSSSGTALAVSVLVLVAFVVYFLYVRILSVVTTYLELTYLLALLLSVLNFIVLGLSFTLGAALLGVPLVDRLLLAVAVFAAAWLFGFLLPGAPGGLGVREASLVIVLGPVWGQEAVLMLALLHRFSSILSDLSMFVIGWLLFRKSGQSAQAG